MTFTPPIARHKAPFVGTERKQLRAWLDYQRATILHKLEGLDDEQLRRVMVPSGLSLLGIVKHLTFVEHIWFVVRLWSIAEPPMYYSDEDPDADFHIDPGESTDEIVSGYLRMCERSRELEAKAESLERTFRHNVRGDIDLRWLMLHMIEETARHAGHVDIFRELIDGGTGT